MLTPRALPNNWRDFITDEERHLTNIWSMWGSDCHPKVGKGWDSLVPGMPYCKTKKEAHQKLSTFVCDMIPLRCLQRMGLA
jgi:hypothetical protein